jgi:hypothetical protein
MSIEKHFVSKFGFIHVSDFERDLLELIEK